MLSALASKIDFRHSSKLPKTTRNSQARSGKPWNALTRGITKRKLLWDAQTVRITERELLWDTQTYRITERKLLWDAKMAQEPPKSEKNRELPSELKPKSENIENYQAD